MFEMSAIEALFGAFGAVYPTFSLSPLLLASREGLVAVLTQPGFSNSRAPPVFVQFASSDFLEAQ